ncbi:MAG: hypothetical protein M1819_000413 [Sarea resinae]|nr:MAG: hypothetical protein M1819_000413 [Sarea resinae]
MAWSQLDVDKPHLAYIIIGGFTTLFMLCSSFVKERLYIGEAAVATICGIIFGPHAANLFNPLSWGNTDKITLECSRIVLVVQCFAVGVELPKAYMERHWRSVLLLLIPVMTYGWLVTSLFIWWMIPPLDWLQSLCCAACVTATDPVLASSVVGKGKFAKRVPKHLRDLLSAESGCNDGMAFPFIFLALYLIRYRPDASSVAYHWICLTVLYECIFGAIYGFLVGYIGRHAIKWAERREFIDRESFLVFYFVLALFCAGSGSILGIDDLLVGFAAGVGFSNDGWFTQKTEESHVSNVIDLLLNLAYFVYLGSIIPWQQYNAPASGTTPWRLVVIAIFVILFRRIPIMMALKPIIPDIKTWREALFAGHFGPIGVGAIFVAIMARAELENDSTEPLAVLPPPGSKNYALIELIWPITTFLVISSILVHGSSIAVFTLGKHINTLTITMSYTQANEEGPSWMNRLPRIQSQAKSSVSLRKPDEFDDSDERLPQYPPGTLPPLGFPGNFLRRQKEEDTPLQTHSRSSSLGPLSRRRKRESLGPGGPISQSAIAPQRRTDITSPSRSESETLNEKSDESPAGEETKRSEEETETPDLEAYQEGHQLIIEDEHGNVVHQEETRDEDEGHRARRVREVGKELTKDQSLDEHGIQREEAEWDDKREDLEDEAKEKVKDGFDQITHSPSNQKRKKWDGWKRHKAEAGPSEAKAKKPEEEHKRGPALAYQFGNTIIVEDEDGEVVKKYDIPGSKHPHLDRKGSHLESNARQRLQRMGTWAGISRKDREGEAGPSNGEQRKQQQAQDDARIRFTVTTGGRRMSKADFIKEIQQMDPKSRARTVEESDAPETMKQAAREDADKHRARQLDRKESPLVGSKSKATSAEVQKVDSAEDKPKGPDGLTLIDSEEREIPYHAVTEDIARYSAEHPTAAHRRRQLALQRDRPPEPEVEDERRVDQPSDSDDDGTDRIPPRRPEPVLTRQESHHGTSEGETAAERRRREAALGVTENENDSEDDDTPRQPRASTRRADVQSAAAEQQPRQHVGIRFADQGERPRTSASGQRLRWRDEVRGKR